MAATTQQNGKMARIWSAFQNLEFISHFFTWLFLLLSRLAEPLMSLSALYVIIESGVKTIYNVNVYNFAIGSMIGAPEIILPGAFIIAGQHQDRKTARLLFGMCWLFVILSAITLLDLMVLHFSKDGTAVLMYFRCAAGVGYSILLRIIKRDDSHAIALPTTPAAAPAPQPAPIDLDELARLVAEKFPAAPAQPAIDQQELAATVARLVAASMPAAAAPAQPTQQTARPATTPRKQKTAPGGSTRDQVLALTAQGMKVPEIALKLGVSRQTVYNSMKKEQTA